jgi:hypothetical protein
MNDQCFAHGREFACERGDVDLVCYPHLKLVDGHRAEPRFQYLREWRWLTVVVEC